MFCPWDRHPTSLAFWMLCWTDSQCHICADLPENQFTEHIQMGDSWCQQLSCWWFPLAVVSSGSGFLWWWFPLAVVSSGGGFLWQWFPLVVVSSGSGFLWWWFPLVVVSSGGGFLWFNNSGLSNSSNGLIDNPRDCSRDNIILSY